MSTLVCRNCKSSYPLIQKYNCPVCHGLLEVVQPLPENAKKVLAQGSSHFHQSLWRYFELLPVTSPCSVVSLGEGETPLLKDTRITNLWDIETELYVKLESMNPTGSFKDRPTSVGISMAKELGQDTVVVASTGNAGASVAAYAARSDMRCIVFIPQTTDVGKLSQIQAYNPQILAVDGNFSDSYRFAKAVSEYYGWTNLVSTFLNPYTVEANKTIAYELYHQMKGKVPDAICVPIGTGPLLVGVWKGYQELFELGLITTLPQMIGVQAAACQPITKAYQVGTSVKAWDGCGTTMAGGISDTLVGYEQDGDLTISTIRSSKGTMISLSESEILESTVLLETQMGVYSEPTGAVSVGAVKKLYDTGFFSEKKSIVSLMTGHGFKYTQRDTGIIQVVHTIEEVEKILS